MERVSLSLLEVEGKARSKEELYKLLSVEGLLYLPPYKFCSVDFMADIIEGKRQALESKEVLIRHLLHIEGLRTADLIKFLLNECDGEHYLPMKFKERTISRDWVGNSCNSLNPNLFSDFVEDKFYKSQKKIIQNKNLSIQALPKFAQLFKSSLMVSTHKRKSNLMLNRSRRNEREAKETDDKQREAKMIYKTKQLQEEVEILKKELEVALSEKEKADENADILHRLYNDNIIDENGNLNS